jgi:hypothetical protein
VDVEKEWLGTSVDHLAHYRGQVIRKMQSSTGHSFGGQIGG